MSKAKKKTGAKKTVKKAARKSKALKITANAADFVSEPLDLISQISQATGTEQPPSRQRPPQAEQEVAPRADVSTDADLTARLEGYNARYAVALFGNKPVVMIPPSGDDKLPKFLTFDAFNNIMMHDRIRLPSGRDGSREYAVSALWLKWAQRKTFWNVVAKPHGITEDDNTPADTLNLFQGWPVKPQKGAGSFRLTLDHIYKNVCQRDREHFEWHLAWLQDMILRPQHKPGSAIVVRGDKGTGKSVYIEIIGSLLHPAHFVRAMREDDLLGQFNTHLAYAIFVGVDEALFAKDPRIDGPLKNMITGPEMYIEPKGVDKLAIKNNIHMLMCTNEDVPVPATEGERRYCIEEIGDARKDEKPYFETLFAELDNGGRAAFLDFLVNYKAPAHVKLHKPPMGQAAMEVVEANWPAHVKWMCKVLHGAGKLDGDGELLRWSVNGEGTEIARADFFKMWERYAAANNVQRPASSIVLGRMLAKLGVTSAKNHTDERVYNLPALRDVRATFKKRFGGDPGEGDLSDFKGKGT